MDLPSLRHSMIVATHTVLTGILSYDPCSNNTVLNLSLQVLPHTPTPLLRLQMHHAA